MSAIVNNACELIGNTPLLKMERFARDEHANIYGKIEAFNPGGSVKDRIGLNMIEEAEKAGLLKPGAVIIEPTSGNTGIGLAWVAAVKGYKLILTMPSSMSIERRKILQAFGAKLVLTDADQGMLGALEEAENLHKRLDGSFMPRQFSNPENPNAHYKTTGPEIWDALDGKIDILVAAVGTGGTVSGIGKYLKEKSPDIKIIAVEPVESAVLSGEQGGPHMIQGIGAGFIPDNYDKSVIDEVVKVSGPEAIETAKEVAEKEGVLVGISSGSNAFAAKKIAQRKENANKNIVTILCDTGERYISTLLFFQD